MATLLVATLGILVVALGCLVGYLLIKETREDAQPASGNLIERKQAKQSSHSQKQGTPLRGKSDKVAVTGGAWITKRSGDSDVLRGLTVHFLHPEAEKEHLLAMRTARKVFWQAALVKARKNEKKAFDQWLRRQNEASQAEAAESVAIREQIDAIVKQKAEDVQTTSEAEPTRPVDLKAIYKEDVADIRHSFPTIFSSYSPYLSEFNPGMWERVVSAQMIDATHTGIDGTYKLEVPCRAGYLYARHETEYSVIEWFLPIHAKNGEDIKIDLQNSNAEFIRSRSVY